MLIDWVNLLLVLPSTRSWSGGLLLAQVGHQIADVGEGQLLDQILRHSRFALDPFVNLILGDID